MDRFFAGQVTVTGRLKEEIDSPYKVPNDIYNWAPFPLDRYKSGIPDSIRWIAERLPHMISSAAQRIEAIERHLEQGLPEGKPFIRPEERPSVDNEAIQQLADSIQRLNLRLDSIEKKLK